MSNRREFILGFLTISALGGVYPALADPQFAINGDDGSPVENFKMPVELDPAQLAKRDRDLRRMQDRVVGMRRSLVGNMFEEVSPQQDLRLHVFGEFVEG